MIADCPIVIQCKSLVISYWHFLFLFLVTNFLRKSLSHSRGISLEQLRFPQMEGKVSVKFLYWLQHCVDNNLLHFSCLETLNGYLLMEKHNSICALQNCSSFSKILFEKGVKNENIIFLQTIVWYCSSFWFSFYYTRKIQLFWVISAFSGFIPKCKLSQFFIFVRYRELHT